MAIEIERKFLLINDDWKHEGQPQYLKQGYICSEPGRVVRVRIAGESAWLTIKGRTDGISRSEWEYPLPLDEAQAMLEQLCSKPLIEKYRYKIARDGVLWEIDEFLGDNAGLVVAEIELSSEQQSFVRPHWLGEEVSQDHRYANASLLRHPYSEWKPA